MTSHMKPIMLTTNPNYLGVSGNFSSMSLQSATTLNGRLLPQQKSLQIFKVLHRKPAYFSCWRLTMVKTFQRLFITGRTNKIFNTTNEPSQTLTHNVWPSHVTRNFQTQKYPFHHQKCGEDAAICHVCT